MLTEICFNQKIKLISTALWVHSDSYSICTEGPFPGLKRPGHGAGHSSPSSIDVKNQQNNTLTLPYALNCTHSCSFTHFPYLMYFHQTATMFYDNCASQELLWQMWSEAHTTVINGLHNYLFSRLYDVSTSSCAHWTLVVSSFSIRLCHSSLLPLVPFPPSVIESLPSKWV
jgi:hypothetical protein